MGRRARPSESQKTCSNIGFSLVMVIFARSFSVIMMGQRTSMNPSATRAAETLLISSERAFALGSAIRDLMPFSLADMAFDITRVKATSLAAASGKSSSPTGAFPYSLSLWI